MKTVFLITLAFLLIGFSCANAYIYNQSNAKESPHSNMISFKTSGFHPSSMVTIYIDNILASVVESDSTGNIASPPYSMNGAPIGIHSFYCFDNYGNNHRIYFMISPSLSKPTIIFS